MFHRRYSNCRPQISAGYNRIIYQTENTSFLERLSCILHSFAKGYQVLLRILNERLLLIATPNNLRCATYNLKDIAIYHHGWFKPYFVLSERYSTYFPTFVTVKRKLTLPGPVLYAVHYFLNIGSLPINQSTNQSINLYSS